MKIIIPWLGDGEIPIPWLEDKENTYPLNLYSLAGYKENPYPLACGEVKIVSAGCGIENMYRLAAENPYPLDGD